RESADIYQQQNRDDLYAIEMEELAVIEEFLPKQLSQAEVEEIVKEVIAETGAAGPKNMGKVMGLANQRLAGQADGKTISAVARALLAGGEATATVLLVALIRGDMALFLTFENIIDGNHDAGFFDCAKLVVDCRTKRHHG